MLGSSGLHRLQPVFVCCVMEGVYGPKIAVTTDPWLVEREPPSETRWHLEERKRYPDRLESNDAEGDVALWYEFAREKKGKNKKEAQVCTSDSAPRPEE